MRGKDLQFEADPAHPLRHLPPVDLHPVAGINPLLQEQWQVVGIFGDCDLGQQHLGRQAAFDDVGRRKRAWMTPSHPLNAYFRRRVTMTRNFAGIISSRSEMSSSISTFSRFTCSGRSSGSITTSIRSRWGGKPLRGRGARFSPVPRLRLRGGDAGFGLLEDDGLRRLLAGSAARSAQLL